jgi:hypothetical protein
MAGWVFGFRPVTSTLSSLPQQAESALSVRSAAVAVLAVLAERAFEFWRFSVSTEQMFIRPGRRVFYLGATVGIEPEGFGQVFIVDETRDTFDRGRWERTMTLKEFRL